MARQSGPIILDLAGLELSSEDRNILEHPLIGGVILFSRNYHSTEQLKELCKSIRLTKSTPLLIAVDQEGGRVQRFQSHFTKIPPMGVLGQMYEEDSIFALNAANACGFIMASELLSVDVDLSFAPVLDLDKNKNTVIGDRAFHHSPPIVIELAKAFIKGMHEAGMQATGKHFPGHGDVNLDSHVAMPIDNRTYDEILSNDLQPFIDLLPLLSGIMTAHIIFNSVDNLPVCFSKKWLQEILRSRLKFNGIIFTDDLSMEGASRLGDYPERVDHALRAGCDFTLVCNNREGVIKILDEVKTEDGDREDKINQLRCNHSRFSKICQSDLDRYKKIVDELQEKI